MDKIIVIMLLFLSFFAWSVSFDKKIELKTESKPEKVTTELEEERDFIPSLSEILHDTKQLKTKIQRQIAKELNIDSKDSAIKLEDQMSETPQNETAHFGDFEVDISERAEEDLVQKKNKKK